MSLTCLKALHRPPAHLIKFFQRCRLLLLLPRASCLGASPTTECSNLKQSLQLPPVLLSYSHVPAETFLLLLDEIEPIFFIPWIQPDLIPAGTGVTRVPGLICQSPYHTSLQWPRLICLPLETASSTRSRTVPFNLIGVPSASHSVSKQKPQ